MNREYRQTERARQAAQTGVRIMSAAAQLFAESGYAGLTLAAVADRAGVTTQTVIRRFGDKEGLTAATGEFATRAITEQRGEAPAGDLRAIVANLVEHYEAEGHTALRLLADEHLSPAIARFAENGRRFHQDWCVRVFEPYLRALTPTVRRRRIAQLVAICDVYTWKLLRLQSRLTPAQTRTALLEMLRPLTDGEPS